jgi:hypothetical protein
MDKKIDYADMKEKKDVGSKSGTGLSSEGGSSKTEGIGTTHEGEGFGPHVKDNKFKSVADASGWGR